MRIFTTQHTTTTYDEHTTTYIHRDRDIVPQEGKRAQQQ